MGEPSQHTLKDLMTQSATTGRLIRLATVDDYLGPGNQRFFGQGFRRVRYRAHGFDATCEPDATVALRGAVSVRYPTDWSRKATGDLRPHFSTLDALVLAAEATQLSLADAYGSSVARSSRTWLRTVRITAGTTPQENLERLPVRLTGRLGETVGHRAASHTDTRIGTMRVRCEAMHSVGTPVLGQRHYESADVVLGPAGDRYYGDGFRAWRQHLSDVRIDLDALRADAMLVLEPDDSIVFSPRDRSPSVSMVDAFVTALQLAQVMLYELDGIRRQDSDTLWMRQTVLTTEHAELPCPQGAPATVTLENSRRIPVAGAIWRTADIVGDVGGVRLRCAVTHRLPR